MARCSPRPCCCTGSATPRLPCLGNCRVSKELGRAYDAILDGRFDQVDQELRRACGPAPAEACDVLRATALWWRILLDPESRALDREFETAIDYAIKSTQAWTVRAPDSAESWFYLGGAYAARAQMRVLRNEKLAAARDGKRIKQALERAVELDPSLEDAYFGIGMYRYLRRRGAGRRQVPSLSPAPAGRRPRGGPAGNAARPRTGASCSRERPTTSCT